MSSIRINIVANLIGKIWSAGIVILLIPFYIGYLGIESYGLVGFYGTLIGSMAVLDMGLSTTLNRQLARYKSAEGDVKDIRNLTFSLEAVYWLIGIIIALVVILLSGFIATHWVNAEKLPVAVVRQSVMLMGVVIAFQWPISLYSGGLTGLDRQVMNNVVNVVMSTLRGAGVLLVFEYHAATLEAFFIWQAALSFLYVLTLRICLWKSMPRHETRPRFSRQQIRIIWKFAAGMTGISAVTFFLSQADKIVLSNILPLSQFGYYVLAFTVASSIALIVGPISVTFFPRFAGLSATGNQEALKNLYHKACRLMAVFIFPVGLVLLFFIHDILLGWTHNPVMADNTYVLARVLIIGSICNALMVIPYNLMIASGWTRFTLYQNTIAAIILVPMLFILTRNYGAFGATFVWLSVNAGYIIISQPLMHRKLLRHELSTWYIQDTLLPMLPSLIVIVLIKLFLVYITPQVQPGLLLIGCIFALAFAASVIALPDTRQFIKNKFKLS